LASAGPADEFGSCCRPHVGQKNLLWDFDRIIVTHGDVVDAGGRDRMRAAFSDP
jgi:hypothetical protein